MPKRRPQFKLNLTPRKKNPVEEILKYMNSSHVERIYGDLTDTDNITTLSYQNIGMYGDRHIIFVTKYYNNGSEKNIVSGGQLFYKSSGTSRGTGLKGVWLPCNGIIQELFSEDTRLAKPEDKYLFNLQRKSMDIYQNIIKYGRFITKENAMISKFLSQVEIPKLSNKLITQHHIDTQKELKPVVDATLSVASDNATNGNAVANAAANAAGNAAANAAANAVANAVGNSAANAVAPSGGSKKRIRRKSKRKTRRKSRRKSKRKSKRKSRK